MSETNLAISLILEPKADGGGCGRTKEQSSIRSPSAVGANARRWRARCSRSSDMRTDLSHPFENSCILALRVDERSRSVSLTGGSAGSTVMKSDSAELGTRPDDFDCSSFLYPSRSGGITSGNAPSTLPLR